MTDDTCGASNRNGDPCGLPAGWGTDHPGEGRCKHHGGAGGDVGDPGGAPEGNGNAQKHALHADRGLLYERLSDDRQQLVDEWEAALIERYKTFHGRDPDRADVEDLFELAVGYAQRRIARAYLVEEADTDTDIVTEEMVIDVNPETGEPITVDVPARMLGEITDLRREDRLTRKHKGLERDPETKQAEATEDLADAWRDDLLGGDAA
jgi:hypothetical protein